MKKKPCKKHDSKYWVESIPEGAGYCKKCVQERYKNAPVCPHCGIKEGFAPGTGDCGCEEDFEIGF